MFHDITRRQALYSMGAGAALLAVPSLAHGTGTVGTSTSTGTPVGVTLDLGIFPRGTTMMEAMSEWQSRIARPLSTKVYLGYRQYPTKVSSNSKIAWAAKTGGVAVICYNPAYSPFSATDAKALANSVRALKAGGLRNAAIVLWSEPIGHKRHLSAAEFKAGFKFYASAAKAAGYPLYCCLNGSYNTEWASYVPAEADGYALDDYASAGNWKKIWAKNGIAWLADRDHKKFGWFEMGVSASGPVSSSTVKAYLADAGDYLATRKPGTTGPCIWYNGNPQQPGGLSGCICPPKIIANNYIIPLYEAFYRKVTQ